ncbi:MAG TPA: VOC family protein, partial [Methanocorpusculum sp.]|nr:VOC family protein [Methanocorpusculum sp.]
MKFSMLHNNINVFDLDRSMKFYAEALGLFEVGRIAPETGDFIIVYLGDGTSGHKLELTWLRDREKPYDLGDNEFHLAFGTDDYDGALAKHKEMGCVAFIN